MSSFLFTTGIENSYPVLRGGKRMDQMDTCGHYARWEEDFALARETGVTAIRYGPAYYRAHVAPGDFDWEPWDAPMHGLRELGLEVIADLCHFGVPDWMNGFQDPAFPILFPEYARAFAQRYPWVRYYTPVNEIFIAASFSALRGFWNECREDEGSFARTMRNLCMAHELAIEAILGERPDAIFVQSESLEHFEPRGAKARARADRENAFKHLSLDLTLGRELDPGMAGFLNEHGVTSNELSFFRERRAVGQRWIGMDYYPACEHRVAASGRCSTNTTARGLGHLARQYYARYGVPLFHCETNRVSGLAVDWLHEQWSEIVSLRASGIPVYGFTWFSLTDQKDWQHGLRFERGDTYPVGL